MIILALAPILAPWTLALVLIVLGIFGSVWLNEKMHAYRR